MKPTKRCRECCDDAPVNDQDLCFWCNLNIHGCTCDGKIDGEVVCKECAQKMTVMPF
jgi:hypothetical protein